MVQSVKKNKFIFYRFYIINQFKLFMYRIIIFPTVQYISRNTVVSRDGYTIYRVRHQNPEIEQFL